MSLSIDRMREALVSLRQIDRQVMEAMRQAGENSSAQSAQIRLQAERQRQEVQAAERDKRAEMMPGAVDIRA
jgi:hypothetical protein